MVKDKFEFQARIKRAGFGIIEFCNTCHFSYSVFNAKISGTIAFDQKEIAIMKHFLSLSVEEVMYFFIDVYCFNCELKKDVEEMEED